MDGCVLVKFLQLHLGHLAVAFIQSGVGGVSICQRKEEQNIAVGTVKMLIETSAEHLQLIG